MADHRDQRKRAWPLFLRVHSVVIERLRDELMSTTGMPLTWFDVLIQLAHTDEGHLPMNELADRIVLSKSGVTRLVDRMVSAGLISREACPTDRRIVYASITPEGRAALEEALPVHMDGVRRVFEKHLSADEKNALVSAFGKILDASTARPRDERAAG